MATTRRILSLALRAAMAVVVVVPAATLLVYVLLRTGLLTTFLDTIVTTLARKQGVFFVTAEGVSGDVPEHLRVKKVEIGDYYGVWLTIEDAEATWHPFDLFHPFDHVKWRVNVDDIHAARVLWTRLPRKGPDEIDTPFHWDKFVRIVAGHLLVDDFELAGSILGKGHAHVRAEGSGVLGEWDHGFVKLDLEHVDAVKGNARVDLNTRGAPLELAGTIAAEEEAGGALAALARLNDAGAVKLSASAGGAMRDWHAEADVTTSNIGTLHAATRLSFTADGPFEAKGTFDPVAAQRHKWLVGDGAPMTVFAKGAWAPDVEVRLDRVLLSADGRDLAADGRLDLKTQAFHVRGHLAHEQSGKTVALTLLDLASADLEGHGTLGDAGNVTATLAIEAPATLGIAGRHLSATLKATDVAGASVPTFELGADVTGLVRGDATLPLVGDKAHLAATGRVDLLGGVFFADTLRVDGGDLVIEGPIGYRDDWHSVAGNLRADASNLSTLANVYRTSVGGHGSARVDIDAKADWSDVDLRVHADGGDVVVGEPGWNAVLAGEPVVDASFHGAAKGPAHAEIAVKTAGIDARGMGDVGAGGKGLAADATFSLDNLARLREPARAAIAGRVEATATARGDLDRFAVKASVRGDHFVWEGMRLDTLSGDIEAAGLPHTWSAALRSRARSGSADASLDAEVAMPDPRRVVVKDLVLRGPRTQGHADLDIDLDAGAASGSIGLKSEDLGAWRPITGLDVGGSVDVDATLAGAPRSGAMQASGRGTAKDLRLAIGDRQLTVDAFEGSATSVATGARPSGQANVHVAGARLGAVTLVDGVASATANGGAWNVDTKLHAQASREMHLEASAALTPGPPLEIALARARGDIGGVPVELVDATSLLVDPRTAATWSAGPFALKVGDKGQLRGQVSSAAARLHVEGSGNDVPLALVSLATPAVDLDGFVDGQVQLDGSSLAGTSGSISLRGHHVASGGLQASGVSPVDVQADARVVGGRITGTAALAGLHDTNLSLKVDVPLATASASTADAFVAELTWKGEIAEVAALLPIGEDTLAGRVDADLHVTGTVGSPRVTGRAVVDGGSWDHAASGLELRAIHAEMQGAGTALELKALTAGDGDKGSVKAHGALRFGALPAWDLELQLEASQAMLARLDVVNAMGDATLVLKASHSGDAGAAVGGAITGSVRILDARVDIPRRFVADVPEIAVTEVGATASAASDVRAASRFVLGLDVSVVADNRIFLTGRGLESEWSSDVHLRGTTADPRVDGKVSSVRGQLSLLGRRFDVTTATLRFDGQRGNEPYLTMTASADANEITAIADVTGPALHPTIELRSVPALPRDEVLSRVLFGQSAATLTAMQSVQLARSIAELTGSPIGGGGGLLTGIGRTLGFDSLGIESADATNSTLRSNSPTSSKNSGSAGGAALTASKYLTDNVYLRVQQGLTPEASKLSIEWKVLRHITIESDVSQDAQGEVGATWRWDY